MVYAAPKPWMPGTRPGMTNLGGFVALLRRDLLAVGDAIDRAVPVVGDQDRAVLHLHHVDRPADILVVFQEAGDQGLHRLHLAVLVEMDDDDVTAELLAPVPRAMARDDDRVLETLREHAAGVEAHAQHSGMRSHEADRRGVVTAGFAPAEF